MVQVQALELPWVIMVTGMFILIRHTLQLKHWSSLIKLMLPQKLVVMEVHTCMGWDLLQLKWNVLLILVLAWKKVIILSY